MIDLTTFRYAIKSNTVHHTVSKTQAAERAGVCLKTWQEWEQGERQPVNLNEILLAVVFNEDAPKPQYKYVRSEKGKGKSQVERNREWRKKNPDKHREYMREYMKAKRAKARE